MTFYIKRPGQREGEPVGEPGEYDHGTTDALEDEWALYLPHQCDAWDIASGDLATTLAEARKFRADLNQVIRLLEENEPPREPGPQWIAKYIRYGSHGQEECDSLNEAINYLHWGQEAGNHSGVGIVGPDGQEVDVSWDEPVVDD